MRGPLRRRGADADPDLVGDRVLVLPSALLGGAAGPRRRPRRCRNATMRLTCLAGLAGLPAVSLPVRTAAGLPAGVCLVAAPGRDRDLLDMARARYTGNLKRTLTSDVKRSVS